MTKYVLIKRDLFECPKHMGYTGIRDKAGVYDDDHVKGYEVPIREAYDCQEEDLYALPFDVAPEFTRACFSDLARDHLMAKIAVLRKELAGAVEALGIVKEQRVKLREENATLRWAFDVLNKNVGYELTWGEVDGEEDDCRWRVHRRNGGRNDTQWTLVATGTRAQDALLNARDYIAQVAA